MQPVVETTFSYLGPVSNTSKWPLLEHLPAWGIHHHPGPWFPLSDISNNTMICPPIDLKKEGLPPATERDSIKWWKENRLWSQKGNLEFFSHTCKLCGPGWVVCCFLPPFIFQMTGFQCLNMMFPVFFWPPDMIKTSVSLITLWSGSVPAQSYNPQRGIWFSGCGSGSGSELGLAGAGRGWNLFPIVLSQYMFWYMFCCCSVAQSCLTLRPHGLQHIRLPCPSASPRVCSKSCPLSRWSHPTISSSVIPFSSCLQSFPASGSFPMSQFFASGGQSIGASASASVLPMSIQGWFHTEPPGKSRMNYFCYLLSLSSASFNHVSQDILSINPGLFQILVTLENDLIVFYLYENRLFNINIKYNLRRFFFPSMSEKQEKDASEVCQMWRLK